MDIEEEWRLFLRMNGNNGLLFPSISSHTNKNDGPYDDMFYGSSIVVREDCINTPTTKEEENHTTININKRKKGGSTNKKEVVEEKEPPPLYINSSIPPPCEPLSISTQTKVLFLNHEIDIQKIFWEIPIIEYGIPTMGIVKKQIKIVCNSPEEYEEYKKRLSTCYSYYVEHIIKQINTFRTMERVSNKALLEQQQNPIQPPRLIKFKDERKITIGLSKKDIMMTRGKVKNAFYNCFALIFRLPVPSESVEFCEIHVKVFNTGKLEIPGVLNPSLLETVKQTLLGLLQPHFCSPLLFTETETENVILINSNFNCGYYINRDKLYSVLRSSKYGIETSFDPCTYPGVKCKFYFNMEYGFDKEKQRGLVEKGDRMMKKSELEGDQKYVEISFMIFRTGSCLIVGNCTEKILVFVYEFIKQILYEEYQAIYTPTEEETGTKTKKVKTKKKMIEMTGETYTRIFGFV